MLRRGGNLPPDKNAKHFTAICRALRGNESSTTASRRSPFIRPKVQPTAKLQRFCTFKVFALRDYLRGKAAIVFRTLCGYF